MSQSKIDQLKVSAERLANLPDGFMSGDARQAVANYHCHTDPRLVLTIIAQRDELLAALNSVYFSIEEWDKNGRSCDLGEILDIEAIAKAVQP